MKQTITIDVPNGYKPIWKNNKVELVKIESQLPKTWEEFCEIKNLEESKYYIDNSSECIKIEGNGNMQKRTYLDQNVLPSIQAAKAHLALMQLHQLRDCYRQGWKPTMTEESFVIIRRIGGYLNVIWMRCSSRFLSFQSKEVAEKFLSNFHNLIEEAGDLI